MIWAGPGQPPGGGQAWTYAAKACPGVVPAGTGAPVLRNTLSNRSVISLTIAPASGFLAMGNVEVITSDIGPVEAVAAETGAAAAVETEGETAGADDMGVGEAFAATVVVEAAPDCGE